METLLNNLKRVIEKENKFAIYGAGEFASILVQYCSRKGFANKIVNCIVTKRDSYTPAHILGVPVIELEQAKWEKNTLIIVAILSDKAKQEVKNSLEQLKWNSQYFMTKEEFRAIYGMLGDFSAVIQCELRRFFVQREVQYERQQKEYENLSLLIQSMPVVAETHQQTFGMYKDANKGKIVVICAPGPSLNCYQYNDAYVHIGLNSVLFNDEIKVDYYFNQHIPSEVDFYGSGCDVHPGLRKKYLEHFSKLKCVKFIGQKIGSDWIISPPFGEISNSNYKPYYISDIKTTHRFCADIRYNFLYGARSIIFPALQFALFTNPEKILIVGSDGYDASEKNYFQNEMDHEMRERMGEKVDIRNELLSINEQMEEIYKEFRKFAMLSYPNTEIIMVNPVHYKGIFKETFTDETGRILL